jgi:hypothetical protein
MGETVPDSAPQSPAQMPASAWDIQAPYAPGAPSPILAHGDADAGGRDDVAGSVAGAEAAAEARYHEHMTDTYGMGSVIGDVMALPDISATGNMGAAYYDPPRNYGG